MMCLIILIAIFPALYIATDSVVFLIAYGITSVLAMIFYDNLKRKVRDAREYAYKSEQVCQDILKNIKGFIESWHRDTDTIQEEFDKLCERVDTIEKAGERDDSR